MPSLQPTNAACQYKFVECGTKLTGSNEGEGSYVGFPSGDVNYLIPITSPKTIMATTCFEQTNFNTLLTLYDKCPFTTIRQEFECDEWMEGQCQIGRASCRERV